MASDGKYGVPLENAVAFAAQQRGLRVEDLAVGDAVTVETINSVYALRVLDPAARKVLAAGNGKHFPTPVETYVNGSSMTGTGSMVRLGWIGAGFPLWIGNVLVTEVQRILVNGTVFQEIVAGVVSSPRLA